MNRHDRRAVKAKARKDRKAFGRYFQTGYAGQNFKVMCIYNGQPDYLLGWTNDPKGGNLMKLAAMHPQIREAIVLPVSDEERHKNMGGKVN